VYTYLSYTHKSPTSCISGFLTPQNHGKIFTHGPILQSFVRSVRVSEGLAGSRREEIIMITIVYGLRYNLDESLIEIGIWPSYNIINTRASVDHEGRRYGLGARTR
jgi:hypothetical protein